MLTKFSNVLENSRFWEPLWARAFIAYSKSVVAEDIIIIIIDLVMCPLFWVAKTTPFFIRVAPVGNWRDNT